MRAVVIRALENLLITNTIDVSGKSCKLLNDLLPTFVSACSLPIRFCS